MRIKTKPDEIWKEYETAKSFNTGIGLYETVKQNEAFFIGDQWRGLKAPDLDKPVLNFLKRVVSYFISMIVADDIGIGITAENMSEVEVIDQYGEPKTIEPAEVLTKEVEKVIEKSKIGPLNRDILRDSAVDGDGCLYFYYEAATKSIAAELVDNTRILFGNPYVQDVQKQPYIIIVRPMQIESAKEMAEQAGADPAVIVSDYEAENEIGGNDNSGSDDRVTVLTKLWKEDGVVKYTKVTAKAVIDAPTNLMYRRYPVAYMSWDKIKNRYHGQAAVTGLIPNQIAVNKLWAMALRHTTLNSFPKTLFDKTKIKKWDNSVGEAIGVAGAPTDAVIQLVRGGDMSAQVVQVVDKTISMTRDFMGASDAALGNVKPDNTSAIIAVQQASSAPLELQRLAFYQFVEDYVRIIVDIITTDYGIRNVHYSDGDVSARVEIDFSQFNPEEMELQVDVGESAYWSELTQLQTLDNLFGKGIITDAITYIESVPNKHLRNKKKILAQLKEKAEQQQMMMPQEVMPDAMPGM